MRNLAGSWVGVPVVCLITVIRLRNVDMTSSLGKLMHYHLNDSDLERQKSVLIFKNWNVSGTALGGAEVLSWNVRKMSPVKHCCEADANEQLNMCMFDKSGWSWAVKTKSVFKLCFQLVTLRITLLDWVIFIWTSYTHTHKWPLGAVFDKQTDWIARVNVCGFSPSLSSRPLRMGPIWLKDMENSTCMLK